MNRNEALRVLETMPEEFQLDDLFYKLSVSEKISEAVQCVEEGRVVSQSEAMRIAQNWKADPNLQFPTTNS